MLNELAEVDKELTDARRSLVEAKKRCVDVETNVINASLHKERLTEALRLLRSQRVVQGEDYDLYDDEDGGR